MDDAQRTYIAIDLKSFYASVECVERRLDPLTTNLVVADASRTEKTICLAVSPSLKAYGIGGRARLFEVVQRLQEVNAERRCCTPHHRFAGKSVFDDELKQHLDWEVDYMAVPPRMALYIVYSHRIRDIYLKYIAQEDIHVYSVDEVFMDVTDYLFSYKMSPRQLAMTIIHDILRQTGITATAGIGTNMYLCKIAMDIVAKHIPADKDGVRIAELDEMSYRRLLWNHRPLTSFWRVGKGIAQKLERYGIDTMGKIARCSIENEEFFYRLFGINAELLIDHAWGWEPCTIKQVKAYEPEHNSFSSGQVLSSPYTVKKARVVIQEMADSAALNLVDKGLVTNQIVITIGYDVENLLNSQIHYQGPIMTDHYGRQVPKYAQGTSTLNRYTSSSRLIIQAALDVFDKVVNPSLLVRRLNITIGNVIPETLVDQESNVPTQLDLFTDYDALEKKKEAERLSLRKEHRMQQAILHIKKRFGKNAILKGLDFKEGATAIERNKQIGGHKA